MTEAREEMMPLNEIGKSRACSECQMSCVTVTPTNRPTDSRTNCEPFDTLTRINPFRSPFIQIADLSPFLSVLFTFFNSKLRP